MRNIYLVIEGILQGRYPEAKGIYILEHNLRRHAQFPALQLRLQVKIYAVSNARAYRVLP